MALNNQNAYLYAGDNAFLNYAITDESNNPLNLTGSSLTYVIAANEGGAAIVTKTTANGGINVTNAAGGLLTVSLVSADTTNLSGMLWQQLVMTDVNSVVTTLSTGTITFEQRTGSQTTPTPPPTPPTGAVFEYQTWAFQFPELAVSVPPGQAAGYFARACNFISNTPRSRIQDIPTRTALLYLATAHIAAMNATVNGQAPSNLVGRISSATEGSVSVSTEMTAPGSAGWWATTRYGYECWSAMAPYRTFHYAANPRPVVQPRWTPGYGGYWQ
jgi:hypothetical protein